MSITGLEGLDRSIHETHAWLNEIGEELKDSRSQVAYHALRGVLFALRDRLPIEEVFDLASQLPLVIRGIYFEAYRPVDKPETYGPDTFRSRVRAELQSVGGGNVDKAIRAVLLVLQRHVSIGEMRHVHDALPQSFEELWPKGDPVNMNNPDADAREAVPPPRKRGASDEEADTEESEESASYDEVDESGFESFPASDPPAWTKGR